MKKYYTYTTKNTAFTTLRFNDTGDHQLTIKQYDTNVVSLSGTQAEIDALIAAQDAQIAIKAISEKQFLALAEKSTQGQFLIEQIDREFKKTVQAMAGKITIEESLSWQKQEQYAREQLANTSATVQQIADLATARGLNETPVQLAQKIVNNADAYASAYFSELGKFQAKKRDAFLA